jgi:hypothetical protein
MSQTAKSAAPTSSHQNQLARYHGTVTIITGAAVIILELLGPRIISLLHRISRYV